MQKGTALTGAALTDEVIESSKSIFDKNQWGQGQKGLQQFFTPPQAAKLIADVIGRHVAVLDPTAGDGSMLKEFEPALSFGVEIDKDQIEAAEGSYKSVKGDIQHVYPLIRKTCDFDAVVLNPPYGLTWEEPTYKDGKPTNSTALTLFYATQLLSHNGQYALICGRDRLLREVVGLDFAKGIYAIVEVPDLFNDVALPCVIAFGVNAELRDVSSEGYITRECPREMLDLLPEWVRDQRKQAIGYQSVAAQTFGSHAIAQAWPAIADEYARRVEKRLGGKSKREFDVQLIGGKVLQVLPSAFAQVALNKLGKAWEVNHLNGASVNYFLQSEREWNALVGLEKSGLITIDPRAHEAVDEQLADFKRVVCPLYPIKPQQRLGYLTDIESLLCTKADVDRGFEQGERYELRTRTQTVIRTETRAVQVLSGKNAGDWEDRNYETARKVLEITVGHWKFTDAAEDSDDIAYLLEHFELPDPGDVGSRHPEETAVNRELLQGIEDDTIHPSSLAWHDEHPDDKPVRFRKFQIEDLARLLVKGSGLISWEQGLGKTLGGIAFTEACVRSKCQDAVLYIVPKDLIPQWQRESKRFTGKELTVLKTHADAKKVAKHLRMGGTGRYITYYEALSVVGTRKSELLPEVTVDERIDYVKKPGTGKWKSPHYDDAGNFIPAEYVAEEFEEKVKRITSKELCPQCHADRRAGWNGRFCRAEQPDGSYCGYSHYKHRVKPMGSLLSVAFRRGVIVVDEGTMIQGDYSTRSEVVRGLRARRKLLMTGTPVKNYIPQAFWLLWWCLGNESRQFPYGYHQKSLFEDSFAVIEWKNDKQGKKQSRKVLPEVTNLSKLWRMLASSIIRRRKEETGEPLVERTFHPITVPLGVYQQKQSQKWLKNFHLLFEEKYPDSKVVQAGMHEMMAPMLGLQQKLDYAATIPLADPDHDWTGVPVSNWTPANLKVIEIAMALAKQNRKVLIGSNLVKTSRFLADCLCEKGVRAKHILDANDQTAAPEKRSQIVYGFQTDDIQVLCTGVQAIRLGHNLDKGSAVILHGLPWDFESLDQFIARVHRLTSVHDVDVYTIVPIGTLTAKKWENLNLKGQAAELALDGRLIEKAEERVDETQIVRELMDKGIPITGDEVEETEIEEAWERWPHIDSFEIPPGLIALPKAAPDSDEPDILDALAYHAADSSTPYVAGGEHDTNTEPEPEPEPTETNYRFEVIADSSGTWAGNAVVLPTFDEAERAALELAGRWLAVREWRVVETDAPANYTFPKDSPRPEAIQDTPEEAILAAVADKTAELIDDIEPIPAEGMNVTYDTTTGVISDADADPESGEEDEEDDVYTELQLSLL